MNLRYDGTLGELAADMSVTPEQQKIGTNVVIYGALAYILLLGGLAAASEMRNPGSLKRGWAAGRQRR